MRMRMIRRAGMTPAYNMSRMHPQAPVVLLDEPLAPLDARVAAAVLASALLGPLAAGRTLVLASRSAAAATAADLVVEVREGRVVAVTPGGGRAAAASAADAAREMAERAVEAEGCIMSTPPSAPPSLALTDGDVDADDPAESSAIDAESEVVAESPPVEVSADEELRRYGHVRWSVWRAYLAAAGWPMVAAALVTLVLMQARGLAWGVTVADDVFFPSALSLLSQEEESKVVAPCALTKLNTTRNTEQRDQRRHSYTLIG